MDRQTETLFSDFQLKRAGAFLEEARNAARILCGASEMGLEVPGVEVLASDLLWNDPNQRDPAIRLYAPLCLKTGTLGAKTTAILMGEDCGRDRMATLSTGLSGLKVREVKDCTTLSPADTAIELTAEDVRHLERAEPLYAEWLHYLRGFVCALTGDGLKFPWPGVQGEGTLYMVANEVNDLVAIREDGAILPVGHSVSDPDDDRDGEREELIRPRIEELRE